MHARVEHLLSLRDDEPIDAAVRAHVEGCARCAATLGDLEFIISESTAPNGANVAYLNH